MAIKIKFDLNGNPEPPTIILANRNGNKLGQLKVNADSIELVDKLNDASEISFTINKYINEELAPLWEQVVDFKLVYCKEWDSWFEIKVEIDEELDTVKTVFCTHLGQAELSQIKLHNIEINTEKDIERDDYKISILYAPDHPDTSILNRILKDKAPHYSVAYVSPTIAKIQRSFSFDNISILDAFKKIAEEIGCLFQYTASIDENGRLQRKIYVYDLQQYCNDCKHRSEHMEKCPECGSTNLVNGYGDDTLIFVTSDELASNGIKLVTDVDSVKNCFKLEAGDDLMTATIRNCNPNGTDYIWYLSDMIKEDMPKELVEKIKSYDEMYKHQYNNGISNIDAQLLSNYNKLVDKYIIYNSDLQKIVSPITGYSNLMNAYYNVIDLGLFLESELMPSVEISKTNAAEQAKLLTASSLSPVAVVDIATVSLATANSAVLAMTKTVVKSTFKVEIKSSQLTNNNAKKYWKGSFVVTNYSDEEDVAESSQITIELNDDLETVTKQKIEKLLNKEDTDNLSITGLFASEYNDFCLELKKYALNPLTSFYDACQSCIDILIDQGVADGTAWSDKDIGADSNLYEKLYLPYYNKLKAIEAEIKIREDEIGIIAGVYDIDGNLVVDGLQTKIEKCRNDIQSSLNFEKYLGEELWLDFCAYRREDAYSNENYISDGLNNAELFEKAQEFIKVAENEIYKSSELQNSISATLNNLLAIEKFKPLVNSFENGNWIRVQINDEIYKLRLIEYTINFGKLENIPVEFSDITVVKNGITDVESILSQASSMATSYDSIKRQSSQGNQANETINNWITSGLNSALVRIQSNNNEDVVFGRDGLICRSYDDITDTYSSEQFRLTHNILAYTSDNWQTVSAALGKHEYDYFDSDKILKKDIDYGLSAKFVSAGYINGSQIIGGEIYSSNYSEANKVGSYINLLDGTFNFAGGKLNYANNKLSVNGEIIATSGAIGGCTISNGVLKIGNTNIGEKLTSESIDAENLKVKAANVTGTLTASQIDATSLKVKAANIDGKLTASQINTSGLIAENISGTTISGKTISGGNINIGNGNFVVDSNGVMTAKSGTFSGSLNAASGTFKGSLSAASGTFAGTLSAVDGSFTKLTAGKSTFATNQIIIDASYIDGSGKEVSQGSIYIGRSGIANWEDITIRPSSNNIGNIGTADNSWDMLYVKNGAIQSSDRNYKTDISKMGKEQELLFDLLSPVTFKFIDSTYDRFHYGFISQEVEDAIIKSGLTTKDFAGFCKDIKRDENGSPMLDADGNQMYVYSLRYNEFIALNTHMIQKLKMENRELADRVLALENKLKQ